MQDRVRVKSVVVLAHNWGELKETTFDYQRRDGRWEEQTRETYDHGHAAAVLPFDRERRTVLLVRQFRFAAFVAGVGGPMLEVCAGLLDGDDAETCASREAEEELGYRVHDLRLVYEAYVSPGSLTERVSCFTAGYSPADRVSEGGGHSSEGEDIEVIEMPLDEAAAAIGDGAIIDAKTILLIQHLLLAERRHG